MFCLLDINNNSIYLGSTVLALFTFVSMSTTAENALKCELQPNAYSCSYFFFSYFLFEVMLKACVKFSGTACEM